jgi:long-chain acyl-CoA synthetase
MMSHAISDTLDRLWARLAAATALRERGRSVSYGELLAASHGITRLVAKQLRQPGQRVALLLPNSSAFVAAFFGAARLGAVVAPLGTQYRDQELAYYLKDLEPVALVTQAGFSTQLDPVLSRLDHPPAVIHVEAGGRALRVRPGSDAGAALAVSDSPALVQLYTSGSTGEPKRVVRTHAQLARELDALRATFGVTQQDRFLGVAPFSHVNGMVRTMMSAMAVGASVYPVDQFNRREVLELITRERITFLGGVPQVYALLSHTPPRGEVDLSSLRVAFSSSAPLLPADSNRFLERYGVAVRQLYGSTETGTISFNRDPAPQSRPDSVGTPIGAVAVEVLDEAGRLLPEGAEGELAIRSPFATSGYVGNDAATRTGFRGGAYLSGDLGTRDAQGHIRITGRKKFIINRGGFKVNPYEVEAALKEHPKVEDAVVYAAPGPQGDDVVCAIVVAPQAATTEELLAHCRTLIADYKIPARIECRDSLPRSAAGKVLRSRL